MVAKLSEDIYFISATYGEIKEALSDLNSVLEGYPFVSDYITIAFDEKRFNEKFDEIFSMHQKDILQKAEELGYQKNEMEEIKKVFNKYKDLGLNCGDWNLETISNFETDLLKAIGIEVSVSKIVFV